jgi:peroxiredoxin
LTGLPRRAGASRGAARAGTTGLLALILLAFPLSGCDRGRPAPPLPPVGHEVGSRAPALVAEDGTGRDFRLETERGRASVILFYVSVQCGFCRERLVALGTRQAEYERLGARIVAVSSDPREEVGRTRAELELGFPVVRVGPEGPQAWGIPGAGSDAPSPAAFVLDADGVIRFRHVGRTAADRVSDDELLRVVETVVRGPGS